MKKILLLTFLALGLITYSSAQSNIPTWKITDVEKYMQSGKDEVLVINFWATFCKPCVAEIPSFIEVTNRYKSQNVKLLLVSLDLPSFYPKKIEAFAKKNNFNTNIVWLEETNADYFCPKIDQKWSGSIPATLIINPKTGYRKFFEEEIEKDVFEAAIKEALAK
ncbi:MAG: TlpA family protein disulfide reductase [Chitinophagaceae bacterium]|nr:MAG: TlpA family protein disulfide reductase [Chitinophagaceae bacterium]